MKKLVNNELMGIRKVLRFTHDRDTVQHILNVIGRENWIREVLEECDSSLLTKEQKVLFESLGGYFSDEEFEQRWYNDDINEEISDRLREQGVTPFLYQNEDYLNSIREGKVNYEGIDVQKITSEYLYKKIKHLNKKTPNMKLFNEQLEGVRKVLRTIHDKETVQHILNVIGREYWDRDTLGSCGYSKLTDEQIAMFDSLGGYYSSEEIDEMLYNDDINEEISDRLREQGVTPFLYQNEDYLNAIREGKVICEGIETKQIINNYYKQINESYEENSDF